MAEITLNSNQFQRRCQYLFEKIKKPLLIILGKPADVQEFNVNSALFHYLLGFEFPETIIIVQENPIAFTSPKKAMILNQIQNLNIVIKNKDDTNLREIAESLKDSYGIADIENIKGDFCAFFLSNIKWSDITPIVIDALTIKESTEIDIISKCGIVSNYLLQKGIDLIRDMNFSKEELENQMAVNIRGIDSNLIEYAFDPEHTNSSLRIGIRYKGYCTEIARSFMSDLTEEYDIQKYVLSLIKVGADSLSILNSARKYIEEINSGHTIELYTIGFLSQEKNFDKNFVLEKHMCFVINISNSFANTFLLDANVPVFLTKKDSKEDYSESKMRFRNKNNDLAAIAKMKEHQKELLDKLVEDQIIYYKNNQTYQFVEKKEVKEINKYERDSSVPRSDKFYLDWNNMFIVVPVLSYSVPFHISTIKNASIVNIRGDSKLRINFKESKTSEENIQKKSEADGSALSEEEHHSFNTFIKSISIITSNIEGNLSQINEMKKEFNKPSHFAKEQPPLNENFKKPVLFDLYMRTDAKSVSKKSTGNLELHQNGFKYHDLVFMFSNIKNIFFQAGDFEDRAILHFNLKEYIIVGGKPTNNIQFFKKFSLTYHDTSKREDEHLEMINQQEEEDEIYRINQQISAFVQQIEDQTNMRVQIPQRGFLGVHSKEAVHVSVTHDCLVSISEQPFFVLNFSDVEIVNFERVTFVTKTFDCVFIFKNKAINPVYINSIETTRLGFIKELLDSHNIVFMETKGNINWTNLMATIMKDPLSFYESGAWSELIRDEESEEESDNENNSSSETTESIVSSTTSSEEDDDTTTYDSSEGEVDVVSEDEDEVDESYESEDESSDQRIKKKKRS